MPSPAIQAPWPRRAWRAATNVPWWLPITLAVVLALDACSRPFEPPLKTTTVGRRLDVGMSRRHGRPMDAFNMDYLVLAGAEGFKVIPEWAAEAEQLDAEARGAVPICLFGPTTSYTGFWAFTERHTTLTVFGDPGWSADQRRAIGQTIDDLLRAEGVPDGPLRKPAQMYRDGVFRTTEPLISGYAHNASAALLALALLWTATIGRPWRSLIALVRTRVRHYRFSHHRCPRCRYDVRGYPGTVCPECGLDWGKGPEAE